MCLLVSGTRSILVLWSKQLSRKTNFSYRLVDASRAWNRGGKERKREETSRDMNSRASCSRSWCYISIVIYLATRRTESSTYFGHPRRARGQKLATCRTFR